MRYFIEYDSFSLAAANEEVCGDTIAITREPNRFLAVVSDGIGTGITASVSSILTSQILIRTLLAHVPLQSSAELLIRTLPLHASSKTPYATFSIVDINRLTNVTTITNYGNPPVLLFRKSRYVPLTSFAVAKNTTPWQQYSLQLESFDTLFLMTDGFPGSTTDTYLDGGLTLQSLSRHIESQLLLTNGNATSLKRDLLQWANTPCLGKLYDDASCLILRLNPSRELTLMTGPPSSPSLDKVVVDRFLSSHGRKIICGGTTSEIVSLHTGSIVHILPQTGTSAIPPYGRMDGVDLVTEGLLTLMHVVEYIATCNGLSAHLPKAENAATAIAKELLKANIITFLLGNAHNTSYSSNVRVSSRTLRHPLVHQLAHLLTALGKEVYIETF